MFSGTCIKDTWSKPRGVGPGVGGEDGRGGRRGEGGEWKQLYLNNNKKKFKKIMQSRK